MILAIIVAIVSLPIWLVPFGPIVWFILVLGTLFRSKPARVIIVSEEVAARERATDRSALRAAIGIVVLLALLGYFMH